MSGIRRFSLPVSSLRRVSLPFLSKTEDNKISNIAFPIPPVPEITEEEVREALLKEVAAHCCYGKPAARDMNIREIKNTVAFHYVLETFTERRATNWISEPFTGGKLYKQGMGEPPAIESIPATPPEVFKSHVYHQEIPFTASIKTCEMCNGNGKYECTTCLGQGWEFCPYCRGNKYHPLAVDSFDGDCMKCHGSGERTCWVCNGDEEVSCKTCNGAGKIKHYIRLLVIWTNHVDDYVVEKGTALKAARIRSVTGDVAVQEVAQQVFPLSCFPSSSVCSASAQLLHRHENAFRNEKVLKQRQTVFLVPVAVIKYSWKNQDGVFHVYGKERIVHVPDYPQKCFCCIPF